MNIQELVLAGLNPADFAIANGSTCTNGAAVTVNSSCTLQITFRPAAVGNRSATIEIHDNAPGGSQTVALAGTGEDFSVNLVSPATATVAPGQTASYQLTVAPSGGFGQTVALTCTGAPPQSTCAVSPASLALTGSTASQVSVTVATTGHAIFTYRPPNRTVNPRAILFELVLFGTILLVSSLLRNDRKGWAYSWAPILLICVGVLLASCGAGGPSSSGGNLATPTGTYMLKVTGTSNSGAASITHSIDVTLVVQ